MNGYIATANNAYAASTSTTQPSICADLVRAYADSTSAIGHADQADTAAVPPKLLAVFEAIEAYAGGSNTHTTFNELFWLGKLLKIAACSREDTSGSSRSHD